jgi:hypothetical protein
VWLNSFVEFLFSDGEGNPAQKALCFERMRGIMEVANRSISRLPPDTAASSAGPSFCQCAARLWIIGLALCVGDLLARTTAGHHCLELIPTQGEKCRPGIGCW